MLWKGEKIVECWSWVGDVQKTDLKKAFEKKLAALNGGKVQALYNPTAEAESGQNGNDSGRMEEETSGNALAQEIDLYDEV